MPSCFLWKANSLSAESLFVILREGSDEGSIEGLCRKLCGLVGAEIAAWPSRTSGRRAALCPLGPQ
jgi:hypothetical protein